MNLETFLLDAWKGTGGFANTEIEGTAEYLKKHLLESDDKFKRRQATCTYTNFVETIAGIYQGYLFQKPPRRTNTNDLEQVFIENANGSGKDLNSVMEEIQLFSFVLGKIYIIVDRPAEVANTAATEKPPYLAIRMPSSVTNEKRNALGELTEITFSESVDGKTIKRTFTQTEWRIEDGDTVKKGAHDLGQVPVIVLTSHNFLINIAKQSLKLFNLESELDELLTSQTFAILYTHYPDIETFERAKAMGALTLGTENGIAVINSQPPGFISPSGDNVNLYLNRVQTVVTAIYRAACLDFLGSSQLSGEALQMLFNQLNARLSSIAKQTEIAEKKVFEFVNLWMKTESEIIISYTKDYNIKSISNEITVAGDVMALNVGSETFEKELRKRIAKLVLDDLTAEKIQQIENDIENSASVYNEAVKLNATGNNAETGAVNERL